MTQSGPTEVLWTGCHTNVTRNCASHTDVTHQKGNDFTSAPETAGIQTVVAQQSI